MSFISFLELLSTGNLMDSDNILIAAIVLTALCFVAYIFRDVQERESKYKSNLIPAAVSYYDDCRKYDSKTEICRFLVKRKYGL